jgi:hypothetical protein
MPALGFAGIAMAGYVFLYSTGVIDFKLTSKVDAFDVQDVRAWIFLALWLAGSVFLVIFGHTRVDITDEGIHYRGVVRSIYIRWSEVTCLHPRGPRNSVRLRSDNRVIELDWFNHQEELSDTIFEHVRENAPNADIDNIHGFLGSLKRGKRSK